MSHGPRVCLASATSDHLFQNLFSGIGHSEDLKEAGIDMIHELPSVGRNFR